MRVTGTTGRFAAAVGAWIVLLCPCWAQTQPVAKAKPAPLGHVPEQYWGSVPPPAIQAKAAVVLDVDSGAVLCCLQPTARMYPASLTKMLTALVAMDRASPDDIVTVSAEAAKIGETTMNLAAGERISVRNLLQGALIASANDGAAALVSHVAGSLGAAPALLNARAEQLGCVSSHFINPHGLHDPQHYSCAWDMAIIARECLRYPLLREIVATKETTIPWPGKPYERMLRNRNRLVLQWEECDGVKTGYTRQAGNCIAASATRDGWQLLAVALNSTQTVADARSLLEWGFANFERVPVATAGITAWDAPVRDGARVTVSVVADRDVLAVSPRGWPVSLEVVGVPSLTAPLELGEPAGHVTALLPGGIQRPVAVVVGEAVPASLWAQTRDHPWARGGGLALAIACGGVFLYGAATKAAGARRCRVTARKRRAHPVRARNGGRPRRDATRSEGRPAAKRHLRGRPAPAPRGEAPVPHAPQAARVPDDAAGRLFETDGDAARAREPASSGVSGRAT